MTHQTVSLIAAVALTAGGALGHLGDSLRAAVSGRSAGDVVAASPSGVDVGSRQEAAGSLGRVLRVATSAVERGVDAINASPQVRGSRFPLSKRVHVGWVEQAWRRWDAQEVANMALAADYLPYHGVRPAAEALQPAPAGWTSLMKWMSESYATGNPSANIRRAYEIALTKTIPNELSALRRGYLRAIDAFGTDVDGDIGRNPLIMLKALEDVRVQAAVLAAKTEVSSHEIAELAHALSYAQGGRRSLKPAHNFTPIFTDSVVPAGADLFVDALTAARELRFEGKPVLFPSEFHAPGSPLTNPMRPDIAIWTSDAVTTFFDQADRHTALPDLWPEGIRRRRFVRAVFPEHPFSPIDALNPDQRLMAAAFYEQVLRPSAARHKYGFRGSYRLHEMIDARHLGSSELEDRFFETIGFPMPNQGVVR